MRDHLLDRRTTGTRSEGDQIVARDCPLFVLCHCQGSLPIVSVDILPPGQSIQPVGTWRGEPAGGEVFGSDCILFFAKEPSGRSRTCREGWGLGRETPGSETLDPRAICVHFNLYCAEAAMLLGEFTV